MAYWKKIYYGAYEINKSGTIRRVKAGKATYPGRKLEPYVTSEHDKQPKVRLSHLGRVRQYRVSDLRQRAWG